MSQILALNDDLAELLDLRQYRRTFDSRIDIGRGL